MQAESQLSPKNSNDQDPDAVLQGISQANFVGFILEQPNTSSAAGGRAEFHGYPQ